MRRAFAALALAVAGVSASAQDAASPFTLCVAEDNAPLSYVDKKTPRGLDVRLGAAIAAELGRPLRVVPFESAYEKESQLTHEVNALLSAGVCEAASGFPLVKSDLGAPSRPNARTPDYPGAKRKRERPYVPLGTLVASRAYLAASLGVALRDGARTVNGLGELRDPASTRVGVVTGTLAGTVGMGWRNGALRSQLVSYGQRDDVFAELAAGRVDAVLAPLALFDGWRVTHPGTPLAAAAWRKPIGINLGVVTLEPAAELRRAIDAVITRTLADGTLARWAAEEGVSWTPPQSPEVSNGLGLAALLAD